MKKQTTLIIGLLATLFVMGQTGSLVPDTTAKRKDTLNCTFVHLKGDNIKVDTIGVIYREVAPMVFLSSNGTTAKTDQTRVISTKYFAGVRKEELDEANIIFIKLKNRK